MKSTAGMTSNSNRICGLHYLTHSLKQSIRRAQRSVLQLARKGNCSGFTRSFQFETAIETRLVRALLSYSSRISLTAIQGLEIIRQNCNVIVLRAHLDYVNSLRFPSHSGHSFPKRFLLGTPRKPQNTCSARVCRSGQQVASETPGKCASCPTKRSALRRGNS